MVVAKRVSIANSGTRTLLHSGEVATASPVWRKKL